MIWWWTKAMSHKYCSLQDDHPDCTLSPLSVPCRHCRSFRLLSCLSSFSNSLRSMASTEHQWIFALFPTNDKALWVVEQAENSKYRAPTPDRAGVPYFLFGSVQPSRAAGRLVTFGRHQNSDIKLPRCGRPGVRGITPSSSGSSTGNYEGYRNDHCFFFLAPSGELILRDLSPCMVAILLGDHMAKSGSPSPESLLYGLHGNPSTGPRQRVIPRSGMKVFIAIGTNTIFRFEWADRMNGSCAQTQNYLAARARSLAVKGMTLTPPAGSSDGWANVLRKLNLLELESCNTPSVAPKEGPRKSCHKYSILGSGGFATVYKSVDLATGELWAVKEFDGSPRNRGARSSRELKASLVREVEHMARISHVSAELETTRDHVSC